MLHMPHKWFASEHGMSSINLRNNQNVYMQHNTYTCPHISARFSHITIALHLIDHHQQQQQRVVHAAIPLLSATKRWWWRDYSFSETIFNLHAQTHRCVPATRRRILNSQINTWLPTVKLFNLSLTCLHKAKYSHTHTQLFNIWFICWTRLLTEQHSPSSPFKIVVYIYIYIFIFHLLHRFVTVTHWRMRNARNFAYSPHSANVTLSDVATSDSWWVRAPAMV